MPLEGSIAVREQPGSYDVELEWTGVPPHVKHSGGAPPHRVGTTLKVVMLAEAN